MFVVGTAGHVDHGKSTLVRALTGMDPDRLREEQERAMTIDLGFAWLTLPSGADVSLVDVPGHERFIKNMLAGVGGVDAALLVVAADEGPMPQTREHLAILDLLGIERGLVVLSKSDLVDEDWLALVHQEVVELLQGTALEGVSIVPVSAITGSGLDVLRSQLVVLLATLPVPHATGHPRLPVDRAFSIAGFGTVVTGTLAGGALRVGDEVELQPTGRRARVRGLQSHRHRLQEAQPSSRVAINLSGLAVADVTRGDVVTTPGWLRPTDRLDLRLTLTSFAPRPLEQNDAVDFFSGAAEAGGRVSLFGRDSLAPGETGWVQLRLSQRVAVVKGDRFILRQPSPSITIGGGVIVDDHPRRHRRFDGAVIAHLEMLARGSADDLLLAAVADAPRELRQLVQATELDGASLQATASRLMAEGSLVVIASEPPSELTPGVMVMSRTGWLGLRQRLEEILQRYHAAYPLRPGMPREELRRRLSLEPRSFDRVMDYATSENAIADEGAQVRLSSHCIVLSERQQREVEQALAALRHTPAAPPTLAELAVDPELINAMQHLGLLVRVAHAAAFATEAYEEMVTWTLETIDSTGSVTVAQLRDRFGTSRRHALALLEHLDERRLTRRSGDARVRW